MRASACNPALYLPLLKQFNESGKGFTFDRPAGIEAMFESAGGARTKNLKFLQIPPYDRRIMDIFRQITEMNSIGHKW